MRASLVALALLGVASCKKDDEPVDVPFKGVEAPTAEPTRPVPAATPAEDTGTLPPPGPHHAPVLGIDGCCAALRAAAGGAVTMGDKRGFEASARVCAAKAKAVREGKLERGDALSQVRSSLLGTAPAACR